MRKGTFALSLISLLCLHNLGNLQDFAVHMDVSEDTMIPGGTPSFIADTLVVGSNGVANSLRGIGVQVVEYEEVTLGVIPGTRSDSREGILYVFVDDGSTSSVKGFDVGLTIASSLIRQSWLSKDVYMVFLGTESQGILQRWFELWYRNASIKDHTIPVLRVACVFDFTASSHTGTPYILSEGLNGQSTFEDYSNVMFEVARELNYPLETTPLYDSIRNSISGSGVHRLHHVFMNYGIPAFTLTRGMDQRYPPLRINLRNTAEILGKHIRAVSGLGHQLHHTSPFFIYSGPQKDVPMSVYLPLTIGLFSPLFGAVLDRYRFGASILHELIGIAYAFAGPLIGLLSFVVVLKEEALGDPDVCATAPNNEHSALVPLWHGVVLVLVLGHIIAGICIKKVCSSRLYCQFSSLYLDSIDKAYTVLCLALIFLDFRAAITTGPWIISTLQSLRFVARKHRTFFSFILGPVLVCLLITSSATNGAFEKVTRISHTLQVLDFSWMCDSVSPVLASFADFWCVGCTSMVVIYTMIFPLILMALETVVFM